MCTNTAWQSISREWMAAQETISAYFKWVVNAPGWLLHPTSQSKQHPGQSPAHSSYFVASTCKLTGQFMPVMDFWACNSNNYMLLYDPGALTQILNLVKWQPLNAEGGGGFESIFSKWKDRKIPTHTLTGKSRMYKMLSLTRISVRLPQDYHSVQCGSSPLKQMV